MDRLHHHSPVVIATPVNLDHFCSKQSFLQTRIYQKRLKQFWELEEIPKGRQFSKEEEACEQHFVNTTKNQDNRFTVTLPFK